MVLGVSGVFVASAIMVHLVLLLPSSASHALVLDLLFSKVDLRIGRLIVFAGFFTFAFALATMAWMPIRRALGWLMLPLGQEALSAYILHLFVVVLAMKLRPVLFGNLPATATENTLLQLAAIAFIWAAIILQPMALTQLRATLARASMLWAAGRAYLYLPSQPSRDL
jgi:hypothetical protein